MCVYIYIYIYIYIYTVRARFASPLVILVGPCNFLYSFGNEEAETLISMVWLRDNVCMFMEFVFYLFDIIFAHWFFFLCVNCCTEGYRKLFSIVNRDSCSN